MTEMLVIRADGSTEMGTGHLMRSLALAQGWRRAGGEALFVCAEIPSSLEGHLKNDGFPVHRLKFSPGTPDDAFQTIQLARAAQSSMSSAWLVADGYHFSAAYQRTVKDAGLRLLVLDDYGHAQHYCADYVLNQNLHAHIRMYGSREPYTRLLLGTRYALLRQSFLALRGWQRETSAVARRVLVTLGGADSTNVTGKVIEALRGLDLEVRAVVGGANPHLQQLKSQVANLRGRFSLLIDTQEMPSLMAWADVAIAGGGSTSWELAFTGLPSLVIVLADNQEDVARRLDAAGVSANLGPYETLTAEEIANELQALLTDVVRRHDMSRRARLLVDGEGSARVVTHLRAASLNMRRAGAQDCHRLWEWANDQQVRAASFNSEPIPWDSHQAWWATKLASPHSAIFIAMDADGTPIGQIRFDWNDKGEAEIGVNVSPAARGGGLGSALIRAGVNRMLLETDVHVFHALVKKDNVASIRAFEKAGFGDAGRAEVRGHEAWRLTLTRSND